MYIIINGWRNDIDLSTLINMFKNYGRLNVQTDKKILRVHIRDCDKISMEICENNIFKFYENDSYNNKLWSHKLTSITGKEIFFKYIPKKKNNL